MPASLLGGLGAVVLLIACCAGLPLLLGAAGGRRLALGGGVAAGLVGAVGLTVIALLVARARPRGGSALAAAAKDR